MITQGIGGITGVDHSIQFGSSAKRYQKWVDWVIRDKKDPEKMPELQLDKTLSSDADIMNRAGKAALAANAMADEHVNGPRAMALFNARIKQKYGIDLTAQDIMVEFLSPTRNFPLIQKKYGFGTGDVRWPKNFPAYILSNKEKYNSQFGEEQLAEWLRQKGVVTPDVNRPLETVKFEKFSGPAAQGKNSLKGFFQPDSLPAWMANNNRQIFQTHGGSEHALVKYVPRMIEGYEKAGINPPSLGNLSGEQVKQIALKVYTAASDDEYAKIKAQYPDLAGMLSGYCRDLLVDAHDQLTDKIIDAYHQNKPAARTKQAFEGFRTAIDGSQEIEDLKNHLAWTYANIDTQTQEKLTKRAEEKIKAAGLDAGNTAGDTGKTTLVKGDIRFKGLMARELKKMLVQVSTAADTTRTDSVIYADIRDGIGASLDGVLHKNWGVTMNDLLVEMANDTRMVDEIRWIPGQGVKRVNRRQTAGEIAEDLSTLQSMSDFFGWSKEKYADFMHDYMKNNPDEAIGTIRHLHTLFETDKIRNQTFDYVDENGKTVTITLEPHRFSEKGRSLGILLFSSAMKGYSIWGDVTDAQAFYTQMVNLYGTNQTSAQRAKSHSDLLGRALALSDYLKTAKYFSDIQYNVNWLGMGNSLSTMISLSSADELGEKEAGMLLFAITKDLSLMVAPQLAVVYTLYGIGAWGWDTLMLAGSKADVIDLLVENGQWDFSRIKTAQPGSARDEGRFVKPPLAPGKKDRFEQKFPELLGVLYYDAAGQSEIMPIVQVTKLLSDKYASSGVSIIKEDNGEKKVIKTVFPRKSLIDVAQRKNFLSNDLMLRYSREAAQSFNALWSRTDHFGGLTRPESWTKKNIETTLKIKYPQGVQEDIRDVHQYIGKGSPILADGNLSTTVSTTIFREKFTQTIDIKKGTRTTFAYFVADYWAKQQALLEGPVLDELIKEASRRKYKQDKSDTDPDSLMTDLLDLLARVKRIDDRVWIKIAPSARPFRPASPAPPAQNTSASPARATTNTKKEQTADLIKQVKNWNPGATYPISLTYFKIIKQKTDRLIHFAEWLNDKTAQPAPTKTETKKIGREPFFYEVEMTDAEVLGEARTIFAALVDDLYALEDIYDKILENIQTGDGFVKKGDGYSLEPLSHLRLDPEKSGFKQQGVNSLLGNGDTNAAKTWLDEYEDEEVKTEKDVATFFSYKSESELTALMARWGVMYAYSQEHVDAHVHPYWGRLLRLRFQIRKLTNILKSAAFLTYDEMKNCVHEKMRLDNESLTVPDDLSYPASTSPHPQTAAAWIKKQIDLMEAEYLRLIGGTQDVLAVKLELSRGPSAGELQVPSELRASATLSLNEKRKTAQPSKAASSGDTGAKPLTDLGQVIKKDVKRYLWGIYTDTACKEPWRGAESNITQIDPDKRLEWRCPLFESGTFTLRLRIYGNNDLILGEGVHTFLVKPGLLKGKLKIWGDWPEDTNLTDITLVVNPCKVQAVAATSSLPRDPGENGSSNASPSEPAACNTWGRLEQKFPESQKAFNGT